MNELMNLLEVEFAHTPVVNFAIQQNRIPIISRLIIKNNTEFDYSDLKIVLSGEHSFIISWEYVIGTLPSSQSIEITVEKLMLSAKFLSSLTEKLTSKLKLDVYSNDDIVFTEVYSIELLPYDQWNGIEILPEMLAAFITPNNPEISKIIRTASSILEEWTGDPSFDAYQSQSPDRVKKQLGAIYEAITKYGIVYCNSPASFEDEGQHIRMCDTVLSQNLGTCLDMAILYSSCIEAVGLNSLIIILKGHAFAGAWLINDTFADIINYDISLLKKRSARGINEIAMIETTSMNAGKVQTFDESTNYANFKLVKEEDFILFVDVKRARFSGIKPLPQRIKTDDGWEIVEEQEVLERETIAPDNIIKESKSNQNNNDQFTKQKLWERKLLDLSLRNNLLNLRITKSTIQLLSLNLNSFEDALAEGDEFQVMAKPDEYSNQNQDSGIYQAINMSDPIVDLLKYDLSHKRLRTYLTDNELKDRLTKLYRSSRLSMEENGANTLYLAIGFLKWYETTKSELARYAPILLLPVEIIRKSAQKGYIIRSREEDTLMNITLLEMLKQDFNISIKGLEELPRDEKGIDVIKTFNIVRRGIMSQSRWDLEEHAFLGIFSFSKFIMWNDIHSNSEKLTENKIVNSLVSGKLEWEPDFSSEGTDLDSKYLPSEIALPISADSTQLEAICAATHNKSFILHGPPGTGKSQTITNIIANALYQGKKVLFVAEKMAALTVVQRRLASIGLDPFCLELHSNKSKKSTVLEQLRKTTEVIQKSSPLEYAREAERLHNQRDELNEYVEAIHTTYPFGFSLYDSFSGYAELTEASDNISFDEKTIESITSEKYLEWCDLIEELQNAGTLCGHPHNHCLKQISTTTYNQQKKAETQDLLSKYVELVKNRIEYQKQLCDLLIIKDSDFNKDKTEFIEHICRIITTLPDTPELLLNINHPERMLGDIIELAVHGEKRDKYRDELLAEFTKDILIYNGEQNRIKWNVASQKWFLFKIIGQKKVLKTLNPLSKNGKISKNKVESILDKIIQFQTEQELLDKNADSLSKSLDFLWNNGNGNWSNIIQICEAIIQLNTLLTSLTEDSDEVKTIRNNLSIYLSDGSNAFIETKGKSLLKFNELVEHQQELEEKISELLKIDFSIENDETIDWTEYWRQNAINWLENIDSLRDWTSWNRVKNQVIDANISMVTEAYTDGRLENAFVLVSFKKSLFKHFSEYIISKDPKLTIFNGKLFEGKIKKFKEQSKYFEELTKAELYAKLASEIPTFSREASTSSENGILQRAIRNKGRGMSLRRLFDLVPNLLPRMCPCMLMSPISVAQYFEVDKTKFDLVIFDEASQMPTCEAVGAIARGQNVIVVGDPKQMPPTNFFSTNHFDEDHADKEDMESILDDCLALSMPSKHLLWHYRSKHESLIAFSNSNYYENKLLTFPSPDDIASKVSNIFVPGYYDRGKTRQNRFEAEAIVAEVLIRLKQPTSARKSLGIVTFSSVQQNLIEDLLFEAFKKNPKLEEVAIESKEPIFIKNLENVQGDERDVILFSVGYGPDKDGKIYLNFGPLNRDGGWRRLNVAVSRARYEMVIFSTLRSEQIDISRTSSKGVAGIKAFLEYSEKGKIALPQKQSIKKSEPQFFERMVAKEIQNLGYKVETDIGWSGYRIDIGIVDPENPTEYLLGILTDGKTYRAAKTAKDREIVQTDVLKMLGWNIYKLWSIDWWDNPQKVIKDIVKSIDAAQKSPNITQTTAPTTNPGNEDNTSNMEGNGITQEIIQQQKRFTQYNICYLKPSKLKAPDDFFKSPAKTKIIKQVHKVILIEAPISDKLLSRRIIAAWGISRMSVKISDYLTAIYSEMELKQSIQDGVNFYWNDEKSAKDFKLYRIPKDNDPKRNSEDLPEEEIVAAIIDVLKYQISLPEENLIKEVAKLFGFNRLGGNVEQTIKNGIVLASENNLIVLKDERYILAK